MSNPLLEVEIAHRQGPMTLEAAFTLTAPWTVLFGPSGSGKTTVLRIIAGFVQPDAGRITYGRHVLVDRKARRWVPPHGRPVRCAGQTACLFPHRTVRQNSVYGQGWLSKPADAMNIAEDVMRLFHLSGLTERLPHELSGGERQRASVARAIVSAVTFAGPGEALLLLDEPFAGLDLKLRDELVAELQAWLLPWKIPVLSVTHDVSEVFLLRAETIRMEDGRVVDQGPAARVLAAERERLLGQLRG